MSPKPLSHQFGREILQFLLVRTKSFRNRARIPRIELTKSQAHELCEAVTMSRRQEQREKVKQILHFDPR